MKNTHEIHNRKSNRLKGFDYSQDGFYFITILSYQRQYFFGKIEDRRLKPSQLAIVAKHFWLEIPKHYPSVILHEYIIMPNHIHGILEISNSNENTGNDAGSSVRAQYLELLLKQPTLIVEQSLKHQFQKTIPRSLGAIVRGYKIGVTKWARQNTDIYQVWHRNYHDHIIRDEKSYLNISKYIRRNPLLWKEDSYHRYRAKYIRAFNKGFI